MSLEGPKEVGDRRPIRRGEVGDMRVFSTNTNTRMVFSTDGTPKQERKGAVEKTRVLPRD